MPRFDDAFLLKLLQACAERAPAPLYPARFCQEQNIDRAKLDDGFDELRRRGLVVLSDWVKDLGQGRALTDAGKAALELNILPTMPVIAADSATADLTVYERGELVRGALYEPTQPYVSRTLLALNLAYFLFGAIYAGWHELPVGQYLLGENGVHNTTNFVLGHLGGLYDHRVLPIRIHTDARPELERMVLSIFLHAGVIHLLMNLFFFVSLGELVESMWGRWRFMAIYVVSGIVSGCVILSLNMLQDRFGLTVGASGCLCGLFASMLVWFFMNRRHVPEHLLEDWWRMLGLNFFLVVGVNFLSNVSWQGHLGGAIGGMLAAVLMQWQRFHPSRAVRIAALIALPIIPAAFLALVFWQAGYF